MIGPLSISAHNPPAAAPLTVSTVQGALKEAHRNVETLERRLEEAEGSRGQADLLKLQELEVGIIAWLAFGLRRKGV